MPQEKGVRRKEHEGSMCENISQKRLGNRRNRKGDDRDILSILRRRKLFRPKKGDACPVREKSGSGPSYGGGERRLVNSDKRGRSLRSGGVANRGKKRPRSKAETGHMSNTSKKKKKEEEI